MRRSVGAWGETEDNSNNATEISHLIDTRDVLGPQARTASDPTLYGAGAEHLRSMFRRLDDHVTTAGDVSSPQFRSLSIT